MAGDGFDLKHHCVWHGQVWAAERDLESAESA
eukprot:CAMPEP_0206135872 /NCGR_PEP_ID=MMETSP1473-20131121/1134_1 /ASSEMBLY_ACC=CAM_ASM_001109 /TAXON_ID=1461547 /ORGANISM="Stichococcus sp, Strain RCC1054" /LENGTH=31 /DNA_ID= /DNA_START= /DNA_END= /DNA_ORIENTATION=